MSQVQMPTKKDNSKLFTIGGAVAGGMAGGPGGAMAGASAGQTMAGLTAGGPGPQPVETSAMSRRMDTMQNDRLKQLREAENSLAKLPPEMQQQYGPAIMKASYMEEKQRGMV